MLILSVDTSCSICRVGLWKDGKIIEEIAEDNKKSHSVKLMPLIDNVLENAGYNINDVDLFATVNGPGSYTGLRIGVTTCKLLGYSTEKPVVTVNTLDFLARSLTDIPDNSIICPCIDARNARVFYGIYVKENSLSGHILHQIYQYDADSVETVTNKILDYTHEHKVNSVFITGDGFSPNREHFISALYDKMKFPKENEIFGTAKAVCDIAYEKFNLEKEPGIFKSENAEVFYLRMPHITVKKSSVE